MALEEERLGHDLASHDLAGDNILQFVALGEASLAQKPSSLVFPDEDNHKSSAKAYYGEKSYFLVEGSVNMSGISTTLLASEDPAGCLALILITLL